MTGAAAGDAAEVGGSSAASGRAAVVMSWNQPSLPL
jgi:hypothetical protein